MNNANLQMEARTPHPQNGYIDVDKMFWGEHDVQFWIHNNLTLKLCMYRYSYLCRIYDIQTYLTSFV